MDMLSDSSLYGDMTTKEIMRRLQDRSTSGPRPYEQETFTRQEAMRPLATRVDTDPGTWHQERSVRPVQDAAAPMARNASNRRPDGSPAPFPEQPAQGENQGEATENGQRREWRNSAWGRQNSSITTGTG